MQGVGGRARDGVRQPRLSRVEQVELLHLVVVAHRPVEVDEAAAVAQERSRSLRYDGLASMRVLKSTGYSLQSCLRREGRRGWVGWLIYQVDVSPCFLGTDQLLFSS